MHFFGGWRSIEAIDHFDFANDVAVHFFEIFGGDPEFLVLASAADLARVGFEEIAVDFEACDVAASVITNVSFGGDFFGVSHGS
jgi:hypothetical protein